MARLFGPAMMLLVTVMGAQAFASETIDPAKFGIGGEKWGALYCKNMGGGRKAVWMNTPSGTYALNGPAISWVQRTNAQGTPLVGYDEGPWKLGREHFPISAVGQLISRGLKQCD